MKPWLIYAVFSMIFAGLTSVLAKAGMQSIDPDLGLGIRTTIVLVFVFLTIQFGKGFSGLGTVTGRDLLFLSASALATALSWICYYRAMKEGPVSYVASIDKASILITLAFSLIFLKEEASPKVFLGGGLIFSGLVVLVWK
jgi:transporter family protein